MTIEGRAVIHFFYLRDKPDENTLARLENAYGEGTVNLEECGVGPRNFATGKQTLTMD
jgi:hypothetical protein